LPKFPLRHEGEEDDLWFLVRVEQEARNIVGGYTRVEHEACLASIPNNGHLNCVLELAGVSYGPHPVPVLAEVADVIVKVSGKRPKVAEKKIAMAVKISRLRVGAGLKRSSDGDILPIKLVKLSKGVISRAIASAAAARVMLETRVLEVSGGTGGAKGGEKCQSSKSVPRTKVAPSAKKRIVLMIGLWLLYLRMGPRNLCCMMKSLRFNRRWILGARQRSLKIDLLPHRGPSLPPKLFFVLCFLLALLGL
jgi:hypothetical protein